MRLCLSCYRLWPRGALFCGACGRSFGGRVCKRRHVSPPGAQVCIQCGESELTEATGYLSFGWLSGLVSVVALLLLSIWLLRHLRESFTLLVATLDWLLLHLFGLPPQALERGSAVLIGWGIVIGLILMALPRRVRGNVSRSLGSTLGSVWRFVYRVLVLGFLRAISQRLRK
jgi:RNA polymerase subunit RPABC4/transcription elongation factor Spt4